MTASHLKPELAKFRNELYQTLIDASCDWGYGLAFGLTQSASVAETIIGDALANIITVEAQKYFLNSVNDWSKQQPKALNILLAQTIVKLAAKDFYQQQGQNNIWGLPLLARAVLLLKLKAKFSRVSISQALNLSFEQIDYHLEKLQLQYTQGKNWLKQGPKIYVEARQWHAECPWVQNAKLDLNRVFGYYLDQELESKSAQKLHDHLLVCTYCTASFNSYKQTYFEFSQAQLNLLNQEVLAATQKSWQQTARQTFNANQRVFIPSFWSSFVQNVVNDRKSLQALLLSVAVLVWWLARG